MPNQFVQGLTTQRTERHNERLPVQGQLPGWLSGTLVRNTLAQYEVGAQSYRHWFDGLAMLHAFTIQDGTVTYANQYLQSPAYRKNNRAGKITYSEFATDPCRSLFSRVMAFFTPPNFGVNANVNIARLADDYLAVTEIPLAVRFDPQTLTTIGVYDYPGTEAAGQITTAHPHFDAQRGVGLTYTVHVGPNTTYNIYELRDGESTLLGSLPVQKPGYIHSFGMTEHYVILAEFALKLPSALALRFSNQPFIENYQWMPEEGARFLLIDRSSGELAAEVTTDAFFAFHHINAFEQGDEIVLDISAYPDAQIVRDFYLDALRADGAAVAQAEFRRYRLPLGGGRASYERLTSENIEVPRINYDRCNMRPYRYVYGAGVRQGTRDFWNQLVKVDSEQNSAQTWYQAGHYPGEPVFIAAPDAQAEDEGVILAVVLDSAAGRSYLLVLDAQDFREIARAAVPQHIPFGFHGQFFGSTQA
jgi:carotenoid cleavage dioxygenase-like enzyme